MVETIISGAGVGENGQAVAIERHPRGELPELLWLNRQLAASSRMRSHRNFVKVSDRDAEPFVRGLGQSMRPIDLVGIEIDVRVKVADRRVGHGANLADSPGSR